MSNENEFDLFEISDDDMVDVKINREYGKSKSITAMDDDFIARPRPEGVSFDGSIDTISDSLDDLFGKKMDDLYTEIREATGKAPVDDDLFPDESDNLAGSAPKQNDPSIYDDLFPDDTLTEGTTPVPTPVISETIDQIDGTSEGDKAPIEALAKEMAMDMAVGMAKEMAMEMAKDMAVEIAKETAKETAKEVARETAKEIAKTQAISTPAPPLRQNELPSASELEKLRIRSKQVETLMEYLLIELKKGKLDYKEYEAVCMQHSEELIAIGQGKF